MSRNLSAAVTSISQLPTVQYRLLCEVDSLSTGMTRACTGQNFIVFNGNTYSPIGTLGGIEKIQEDADIYPRAVRMFFSAVNTAQIQDVLTENLFNRPVRIYRTFLTESFTNVATPEMVFVGRINTCDMKLKDPQRADYFEIEVESRLMREARAQYFNRETLWTVYSQSGDTFFDYITKIALRSADWGLMQAVSHRTPLAPGTPGSAPGRTPGSRPRDRHGG
jgi:hypothetical protein